jgi:hypothetical protein
VTPASDHDPADAWSVCPTIAVPVTTGACVEWKTPAATLAVATLGSSAVR